MDAHGFWKTFTRDTLNVKVGVKVLDIGRGPADVLQYLPQDADYWGFDISHDYIQKAQLRYGLRGQFFCKLLEPTDLETIPKFDRVILTDVFHHLDDKTSKELVIMAYKALKNGGKLASIDPYYMPKQNLIARFLISKDRGQSARRVSIQAIS